MSPAPAKSKPFASGLPSFLDPSRPVRSLSISFWVWKAILFVVIISCPGLGYDTSASLLPFQHNGSAEVISFAGTKHASLPIALKFVRWDSIYFVHIAQYGYLFEQEWAFSYVYGSLANHLSSLLSLADDSSRVTQVAVAAVALSHVSHYLSVLALYWLSVNIFGRNTQGTLICFLSAALHIVCPGGAFLSAPYGESLFSFLNITGYYIYSSSCIDLSSNKRLLSHGKLLLAGCLFAAATSIRSNGILSGVLLAYDAMWQAYKVISRRSVCSAIVRLGFTVISGCIVALGLLIPQYLAYISYCLDKDNLRPWCQSLVPSIYGWVQSHYWGVGFLGYWTVPNIPLFLLATPMLLILFLSSFWVFKAKSSLTSSGAALKTSSTLSSSPASSLLTQLAIVQFILTVMAVTSYHVQIVNRISSGYPLWYWYLAWHALKSSDSTQSFTSRTRVLFVVQIMVAYALVQAVLFGSFLPPA
ncbi:GPI mannosyltransferase 2 [Aspergillus pseudoustus]|uniref:GPI mannosyltransferase 2 n=1 Tax=Aspergillus pseudoustus TaxID=1810923 RepID=A0ABR4KJD5_9EURO